MNKQEFVTFVQLILIEQNKLENKIKSWLLKRDYGHVIKFESSMSSQYLSNEVVDDIEESSYDISFRYWEYAFVNYDYQGKAGDLFDIRCDPQIFYHKKRNELQCKIRWFLRSKLILEKELLLKEYSQEYIQKELFSQVYDIYTEKIWENEGGLVYMGLLYFDEFSQPKL